MFQLLQIHIGAKTILNLKLKARKKQTKKNLRLQTVNKIYKKNKNLFQKSKMEMEISQKNNKLMSKINNCVTKLKYVQSKTYMRERQTGRFCAE